MSYKRTGRRLNPEYCRVGRPPLAVGTGMEMQRTISYLMQWHQQEAVMESTGVPDTSIMLDAPNNGGVFHFGIPFADRTVGAAHDRQFGIIVRWWELNTKDPVTGVIAPWYMYLDRDFAGGPDEVLVAVGPGSTSDAAYGDGAAATAQRCFFHDANGDPLVIPTNAGAFWHAALRVENMMVAALAVFPWPYSPALVAGQEQLSASSFAAGRVLRGHDAAAPCTGSIGSAIRLLGDGGIDEESCESLTRRLLWSWCHGVGLYASDPDVIVSETIWPGEILIEPRGLAVNYTSGWAWPLLYVTGDEDVTIKITNDDLATAWTFVIPAGGYAVATQVDYTMGLPVTGLEIDPTVPTHCRVSIATANAADEVLIHSLFIWEGDPWP